MNLVASRTASDRKPSPWAQALREGAVTGSVAAVLSTAALTAAGARESGNAVAPLNAVSHWLWGDAAARVDRPTLRHTLVGFLTQHAASVFWATLYARLHGHRAQAKQLPQAVAGAIATSAVAYLVDYKVVPQRVTPGYEYHASDRTMLAVYAALAAGLALGAVVLGRMDARR